MFRAIKRWISSGCRILGICTNVPPVEPKSPLILIQTPSISTPPPPEWRTRFKMEWKYFTEEESKGLVNDLMYKLDRARELFGAPLIITSGYRDPEHNAAIGGVKDSAHTKGMAVDIRCADNDMQKKLIWALCVAGFRRVEAGTKHIHVDVDDTKTSPCFWFDESK